MSKAVNVKVGTDVSGLLLVAFIILKLCNVIDWPWWLVLAPMWAPLSFLLAVLAVIGFLLLVAFVAGAIHTWWERRK